MRNMATGRDSVIRKIDWYFIVFILVLSIIGLICLFSATHGAYAKGLSDRFVSQVIWLSVGWGLFALITLIDYKYLSRLSYIFYAMNLIALILVPIIGKSFYGARRWLDLGLFRYQPSETMKIALILLLASYFSKKTKYDGLGVSDLIIPGILTIPPFLLVVRQPDLGTGLLLLLISLSIVFFVKLKKSLIVAGIIISVGAVWVGWNFSFKDYQKNRVLTFLNPGSDPRGAGYNSIQSKIAVGSGEFVGKGFRKGTQSQLEFLPERHTDFIFSVLSEEFGFLGSFLTLLMFGLLFWRGIYFASVARDKFGALLAVGGLSYLFWHMLINTCMVIGLMPIVGVPLPLMSYGGSGMIATMISLGFVSSVAFRKNLF